MPTRHRGLHVQTRMLVSISVRYLLVPYVDGFYVGLHKYSMSLYDACIDSFHALPVAALVDHKFFCVHGGISPHLVTLKDLERVRVITPPPSFSFGMQIFRQLTCVFIQMDRFREPGSHGLLCDLLWSDPISNFGNEQGSVPPGSTFLPNSTRGCSFYYT